MSLREGKWPAQSHADTYVAKPESEPGLKPKLPTPGPYGLPAVCCSVTYTHSFVGGPLSTSASLESGLLSCASCHDFNYQRSHQVVNG